MAHIVDKMWHLAANEDEVLLTDFELSLWRVFNGFIRWAEDCNRCVSDYDLDGFELAVFHVVRIKDRPKTVYEVGRLLNQEDISSIQYVIRKLLDKGLIEKVKIKGKTSPNTSGPKFINYQVTETGKKIIDDYVQVRKDILVNMIKGFDEFNRLEEVAKILSRMIGIYDECGRIAATYRIEPDT